jgi:hypothetical protein
MDYQLVKFWPGIQVHWNCNGNLWASRGRDIITSSDNGESWDQVTRLPTRPADRWLGAVEPARRLLRLDIRSYLQLNTHEFMVFRNGEIFLGRHGDTQPTCIGHIRRGKGPLPQGACVDDNGNCYYGEYWRNPQHEDVNIYTWRRDAAGWQLFYSFAPGAIRHIHAIQFDPFSRNIWIATGDQDSEANIGYFETSSSPPQMTRIASGGQMARAVSLLFTREYVYWGSDRTDGDANYVYRWSRSTKHIEQIARVGGPVYYSTVGQDGRLFMATVVEGCASEYDSFARVWMSVNGVDWHEIRRWKKDIWPFIFGNGVLFFPGGSTSETRVYIVGSGVQKAPGTWVLAAN